MLCDDTLCGGSSQAEQSGMALLEFGRTVTKHQTFIGEASKSCLADPRLIQNRWEDVYHWLALLADEFVGLDSETIAKVIIHGEPIQYAATTALIARLGNVPTGFCHKDQRLQRVHFKQAQEPVESSNLLEALIEYGYNSETLHPKLFDTLQKSLFLVTPFSEPDLKRISRVGEPGVLISTLLRFIYNGFPKAENAIQILDATRVIFNDRFDKLAKVWMMLHRTLLLENGENQKNYLEALDRKLTEGSTWKLLVAWDILEIRGELTDRQIPIVFSEYVKHQTDLHAILFPLLCAFLSKKTHEPIRTSIVKTAEETILYLNETPWCSDSYGASNIWAELLFPTIIWAYGGKNSVAVEAVFLRGIRGIFNLITNDKSNTPQIDPINVLAQLDPLLEKVSSKQLESVIQHGIDSQEPSVSVFCRLITSWSDHIKT